VSIEPFSTTQAALLVQRFLAQNKQHAVIVLDEHGLVLEWLGASEWLLGYSADEMVGRSIAQIFTPQDRQRGMPAYELEVAASSGASEDDRWHVRRDGTSIWVTGAVHAIREDDRLHGYVKVMRDRTNLRIHVESLERRLDHAVERYRTLERALATLGHEVRGPLGTLKNGLNILSRPQLPADLAARQMSIMERQVDLLERLSHDVVEAVRADTGKLRLELAEIDFNPLVQEVAQSMADSFEAQGQELVVLLPPTPTRVLADAARLRQIISNLLDNAKKYTPEGGTVWVTLTSQDGEARLLVQDNGIGIAPGALAQVFELFTQEERALTVAHGGLGVGLALVKQLAELHGGGAEARSAGEGQGSEFCVRLPLQEAAGEPG
jgi:PAS domain S-box-containing protein